MNMMQDMAVTKYLGLDLGGTNIKSCVLEIVDGDLAVIENETFPTGAELGPESVAEKLIEIAQSCISVHPDVSSIGLGVPGTFDHKTGIVKVFPNLTGPWDGFPLVKIMNENLPIHVRLINDARAFSLAEAILGAARNKELVACLVLGTGVGGGLIFNGKVHMGATDGAGEIAHQIVQVNGPLCGCGQFGCLETFVSSAALCSNAGTKSPAEAYEKALAGDSKCLAAFEDMGEWLGLAIANLVNLLGPDVFVIGGGVAQSGELLLNLIRKSAEKHLKLFEKKFITIVAAELGTYAGSIGAALYGAINAGAKLNLTSIT